MNINNVKIFNKIIGYAILILLLFTAVVVFEIMPEFEKTIYSEKEENVKQNTEVAYYVFESKYKMFLDGKLTEEEAKVEAKNAIKKFRYDDGAGYFWINDYEPNMIMHPKKPQLDDTSLKNTIDPNGKKIFVEMANVVRKDGSGFVHYQWAKPGKDDPVDKISYVKGFEKWQWIIGSGIYVDDVEEELSSLYTTLMWFMLILIAVIIAVTYLLAHNISNPVAEGDVDASIEENRGDELGELAKSFNKMTSNIKTLLGEVEERGITAEIAANEAKVVKDEAVEQQEYLSRNVKTLLGEMEKFSQGD